jgi:pimeloyl-ACP methyl ester carboxylesterase
MFTYESEDALAREIDEALSALRARWPDHVDDGPVVYAGFSLGSFQGVEVVTRAPERTPRVVLIEGGHDPWNESRVRRFAENGGKRVLFVTGQTTNEEHSLRVAHELSDAGVFARVEHVEGAGHVHTGQVRDRLSETFDWVVEDDDRWRR